MNTQTMELKENRISKEAEVLYEKYRDQMDTFSKSIVAKVKGGLQTSDVYSLGRQLEQWDAMKEIAESDGNISLLGKLPTIAY